MSIDKSEKMVKFGLKASMLPNYINSVIGMNNPNSVGFIPENKTYESFIEKNDNNTYSVKIGFSVLDTVKSLDKAKKIKREQPPLAAKTVQNMIKEDFVKFEKLTQNKIDSDYGKGAYSKLPIKSQFVLQDYVRTGHSNNKSFFDAVVKNDYKEAMKNYIRPGIGQQNEFFKNVMFAGPVDKNDFANTNQIKRFTENMLDKLYPNMKDNQESSGFVANDNARKQNVYEDAKMKAEKGGKADVVAEFTGGELVNNREEEMREEMKKGNNEKAAKIFKEEANNPKNVTPGAASHKKNPLPVAADGTVMDKNGKDTGVKAVPGAGVYDHIKDQYKPGMSTKQVIDMIVKNHKKWKKNNIDDSQKNLMKDIKKMHLDFLEVWVHLVLLVDLLRAKKVIHLI